MQRRNDKFELSHSVTDLLKLLEGRQVDEGGLGEYTLYVDLPYSIQPFEGSDQIEGLVRSVPVIRKLRSSYNKKTCTLNRRGKWDSSL